MAKQIAPRAKYLVMVIVIARFIFVFSLGLNAFGFFCALSFLTAPSAPTSPVNFLEIVPMG